MRVFLSWSGDLSKEVALILRGWIERNIQAAKVFMSDKDIKTGTLWFTKINEELRASVGIICLTQENFERPWLLFEAGSIAKGLENSCVCPLLIDLDHINLKFPLAAYQASKIERESFAGIATMINSSLPEDRRLSQIRLEEIFDDTWKKLHKDLQEAIKKYPPQQKLKRPPDSDLIAEILELTRNINNKMNQVETAFETTMDSLPEIESPLTSGGIEDLHKKRRVKLSDSGIPEWLKAVARDADRYNKITSTFNNVTSLTRMALSNQLSQFPNPAIEKSMTPDPPQEGE